MAAGRIVRTNITLMLPPSQWATLVPANDEDIFQSALALPVSAISACVAVTFIVLGSILILIVNPKETWNSLQQSCAYKDCHAACLTQKTLSIKIFSQSRPIHVCMLQCLQDTIYMYVPRGHHLRDGPTLLGDSEALQSIAASGSVAAFWMCRAVPL